MSKKVIPFENQLNYKQIKANNDLEVNCVRILTKATKNTRAQKLVRFRDTRSASSLFTSKIK